MKELRKVPRQYTRKKDGAKLVRYVRRESNEEILHKAGLYGEEIRLRVLVQIRHPECKGMYVGWQGLKLSVDLPSVSEAKKFVARLSKFISEEDSHGKHAVTRSTGHQGT